MKFPTPKLSHMQGQPTNLTLNCISSRIPNTSKIYKILTFNHKTTTSIQEDFESVDASRLDFSLYTLPQQLFPY